MVYILCIKGYSQIVRDISDEIYLLESIQIAYSPTCNMNSMW